MAGLGLSQAVANYQNSYQNTTTFNQQQQQIARAQQLQAERDAVNQESAGVMKQALQDHVMRGGKPEEFRPPEDLMFRVGEQRSAAFAKRGLIEDFYGNEAKLAPLRMQARAKAVQEYKADRDPVKFIMSLNRSQFNGKDIEGVNLVEGAESVQGLPARPGGVQIRFKGEKKPVFVDPEALAKSTEMGLLEPKEWAKNEAQEALKRLTAKLETEKGVELAITKGEQDRQTDDKRTRNDKGLAEVKFGYDSRLREQTDAAADKRNERSVDATKYSADVGLKGRKYAADQGLAAAGVRAKGDGAAGGGGKRDQAFDQIHDELIRSFGKADEKSMSGQKLGDEFTLRAARYAQDLVEKEGLSMRDALLKAGAELKKRRPQ